MRWKFFAKITPSDGNLLWGNNLFDLVCNRTRTFFTYSTQRDKNFLWPTAQWDKSFFFGILHNGRRKFFGLLHNGKKTFLHNPQWDKNFFASLISHFPVPLSNKFCPVPNWWGSFFLFFRFFTSNIIYYDPYILQKVCHLPTPLFIGSPPPPYFTNILKA